MIMKKMKAGFVGFLRGDDPDFWDNMETLSKLGYRGFEGMRFLMRSGGEDAVKRVKDMGFSTMTCGAGLDEVKNDIKAVIAEAKKIGSGSITLYSSRIISGMRATAEGRHCSYEMFMEDVQAMEQAALTAKDEGLEIWYHNHNTEFSILFDGYRAMDLMLMQAENVHMMLDVGWCAMGGTDPVIFMKRWPDRMRMLHIKDYQEAPLRPAWGAKYHSAFTTPGTGVVDIAGVLKLGCELGLEWASVEMDSMNQLTPMLSLQTAYCNMKEYGWIE